MQPMDASQTPDSRNVHRSSNDTKNEAMGRASNIENDRNLLSQRRR